MNRRSTRRSRRRRGKTRERRWRGRRGRTMATTTIESLRLHYWIGDWEIQTKRQWKWFGGWFFLLIGKGKCATKPRVLFWIRLKYTLLEFNLLTKFLLLLMSKLWCGSSERYGWSCCPYGDQAVIHAKTCRTSSGVSSRDCKQQQ